VIRITDESQRVGDVSEDDLTEEEREGQTQHRKHPTRLRLVPRTHCATICLYNYTPAIGVLTQLCAGRR